MRFEGGHKFDLWQKEHEDLKAPLGSVQASCGRSPSGLPLTEEQAESLQTAVPEAEGPEEECRRKAAKHCRVQERSVTGMNHFFCCV